MKQIYNYLKYKESIDVARKVRDELIFQTKKIVDFPEKFEKEQNLLSVEGDFRYKVVWSYKIIYEVASEAVYVLDIFHTSRDPSNIKKTK